MNHHTTIIPVKCFIFVLYQKVNKYRASFTLSMFILNNIIFYKIKEMKKQTVFPDASADVQSFVVCQNCHKNNVLVSKYEKLVILLNKQLKRYQKFTQTSSTASNWKQNKVANWINTQQSEQQKLETNKSPEISDKPFKRIQLFPITPSQNKIFKEQTLFRNGKVDMTSSAPNFFGQHKRVFRETRFLSMIHALKMEIQQKKCRIESLENKLFEAKNLSMHLRKIVYEFVKSIDLTNGKKLNYIDFHSKRWQILQVLIHFFQYSEEEVEGLFLTCNQNLIKKLK